MSEKVVTFEVFHFEMSGLHFRFDLNKKLMFVIFDTLKFSIGPYFLNLALFFHAPGLSQYSLTAAVSSLLLVNGLRPERRRDVDDSLSTG